MSAFRASPRVSSSNWLAFACDPGLRPASGQTRILLRSRSPEGIVSHRSIADSADSRDSISCSWQIETKHADLAMPIDLIELGAKCRRVREEILDMTLMQASELTGIEQARLASIERGVVEPTGDEVLIIADVYGEPVEFFITNERSASIEKSSDLYRMYGSTFSSADRRNIQEFLTLCHMEHEIEALLGSRPREFDSIQAAAIGIGRLTVGRSPKSSARTSGSETTPSTTPFIWPVRSAATSSGGSS